MHLYNQLAVACTCVSFVLSSAALAQTPIIIDNTDVGFSTTGIWTEGTYSSDRYGSNYQFADSTGSGSSSPTAIATWQIPITETGYYDIAEFHPQGSNRASDAPFTIETVSGNHNVVVNQKNNGGQFNSLGSFHFNAGDNAIIRLKNNAEPNVVMADAISLTRIPPESVPNEYRFFWVSRYQWPSGNENSAKSNINNIFQTAADNHFNGVMFQIRGQMDTHYPSPYEPWTNTYGWTDPGWDPLAYAINAAHSRNVELYAYFNTHTIRSPTPPSVTSPQHIYNLHGPGAPSGAEHWEARDLYGNPIDSDGYLWLSPGIPEASFHTRRELMYLVDNYAIDGVHFDRIRTSIPDASHDPISTSRFQGDGNPDGLSFQEFTRDQITRDLRKIYGAVQFANHERAGNGQPNVKISSSPIGISRRNSDTEYQGTGTPAWYTMNQDAWAWLKAHVMDFVVPQIYWEVDGIHPHEKILADWVANSGGRWIVPGSRTAKTISGQGPKTLASLLSEWQESVSQGTAGKCYWNYASLNDVPPGETQSYYEALLAGPYQNIVTPPQMPWKTTPTTGFITGYVLDESGNPVVDAWVTLQGDDHTYTTAWDGFFSILDVPPGSGHTVTATKYGSGSASLTGINVVAGDVTSNTLSLNPHRGFVDFTRTTCVHDVIPTPIRLYDVDLAGTSMVPVQVTSPADPVGETVVLTAEGGGRFTGEIDMDVSIKIANDQKLQAMPGTSITVHYTDANTGSVANVLTEAHANVVWPHDVICESRTPSGTLSDGNVYQEISGSWSNTSVQGPNNEVIKSLAPELSGLGSRASQSANASFQFNPPIKSAGHYNVYVTIPDAYQTTNFTAGATNVRIIGKAPYDETITVDLSSANSAVAGKWLLLKEDVPFENGNIGSVKFTNQNANTSNQEQFSADAVKLVFRRPFGISAGVENWSLFY